MKLDTKFIHTTLNNGLRVHATVPVDSLNTVQISAVVKSGSIHDPAKKLGIAHYLEHMALSGNKVYNKLLRNDEISKRGVYSNAYTTYDHTVYTISGPSIHFEFMLKMMYHDLFEPLFDAKNVATEKDVILAEFNMRRDNEGVKFHDWITGSAYAGLPYGNKIIGTRETVSSITQKDLISHAKKMHVGNNIELLVVGNYDQKVLTRISNNKYAKVKSGEPVSSIDARWIGTSKITFNPTNANNAYLGWLYHSSLHNGMPIRDRWAESLARRILGYGSSSRMFRELREKRGLCYYCGVGGLMFDTFSYTYTYVNCDNDKVMQTKEALAEIINKYVTKGATLKELNMMREMARNEMLVDADNIDVFSRNCIDDYIASGNHWSTEIESMTNLDLVKLEHVNDAIKRVFTTESLYCEQSNIGK